jgi:hypothetical protein
MKSSFDRFWRSILTNALSTCASIQKKHLGLIFHCAEWFTCPWFVQRLNLILSALRLSSLMDIDMGQVFSMSHCATSAGRRGQFQKLRCGIGTPYGLKLKSTLTTNWGQTNTCSTSKAGCFSFALATIGSRPGLDTSIGCTETTGTGTFLLIQSSWIQRVKPGCC